MRGRRAPRSSPSEHRIQAEALVGISGLEDTLVWRNNTGTAWQGQRVDLRPGRMVEVEQGMVILRNARPISFGLEGSSDIIGVSRGRGLAVEIKDKDGRQSTEQLNFGERWTKCGGIYILARSAESAVRETEIATLIG